MSRHHSGEYCDEELLLLDDMEDEVDIDNPTLEELIANEDLPVPNSYRYEEISHEEFWDMVKKTTCVCGEDLGFFYYIGNDNHVVRCLECGEEYGLLHKGMGNVHYYKR